MIVEKCRKEREEGIAGAAVTEIVRQAFVIGRIAIVRAAGG